MVQSAEVHSVVHRTVRVGVARIARDSFRAASPSMKFRRSRNSSTRCLKATAPKQVVAIYDAPSRDEAKRRAAAFIAQYETSHPRLAKIVEDDLDHTGPPASRRHHQDLQLVQAPTRPRSQGIQSRDVAEAAGIDVSVQATGASPPVRMGPQSRIRCKRDYFRGKRHPGVRNRVA